MSEGITASAGSELALLAAAAGKPVQLAGQQRTLAPEALLGALHRHIASFDYFDPWTGAPIDVERWIDILAEWRAILDMNREIAVTCGIAAWKKPAMARFLWSGTKVRFQQNCDPATFGPEQAVALWPSRVPHELRAAVRAASCRLVQIEDGFIRSSGLGVQLVPPCSIVADRRGIYYDPRQPSDLEQLLSHHELGPELCERAERLIRFIVAQGITKYGMQERIALSLPMTKRRVLIAGQVADDRSVQLGRGNITDAVHFLRRVRESEPGTHIIFKPHPDVVAGLRRGHVPPELALKFVDQIVDDAPIDQLISEVDAVHVLTSLTGFEALLRGREVVTHGQPFYAGWGLTRDLGPSIDRRGRDLSLAQLAAATLILYPRYLDPITRLPCPPELLVERLAAGRLPTPGILPRLRALQGGLQNWRRDLTERAA